MRAITTSRRNLVGLGAIALVAAASASTPTRARTQTASGMTVEEIVQRYYKAWEKRDWQPFDVLLADNFTFTSANDDDHISKSAFKSGCWESQKDFIDHFEIERAFFKGNEAFVKYVCHTVNGKSFRNVEYVRIRGERVESIEAYFGGHSSFASAVSTGPVQMWKIRDELRPQHPASQREQTP